MAAVPVVVEADLVRLQNAEVGDEPIAVAVDAGLRRLYVVDRSARMLLVHDAITLTQLDNKPLGSDPGGLAVDPTTHAVYVANSGSGSITLYDPLRKKAREHVVGGSPSRLAIDATRGRVIVSQRQSRWLEVLNRDLSPWRRFLSNTAPADVAVHPVSGRIYVLSEGREEVRSFSPDLTPTVPAMAPTGPKPLRLAIDPVLDRVFVLNTGDGTVTSFNAGTMGVVGAPIPLTLPASQSRSAMSAELALDVDAHRLYVANRAGTGSVSIINTGDPSGGARALLGRPEAYLAADQRVLALAVSASSGQVFLLSGTDRSLKRLVPVTRKQIVGGGSGLEFSAVVLNPAMHKAYIGWRQNSALLSTSLSPAGDLDGVPLGIGTCLQPRDPAGLVIDSAGAHGCRLYAACPCAGRIVTVDCSRSKLEVLSSVVSPGATGLTLDVTGARLFVTAPSLERLRAFRVTANGVGSVLGQASLSLSGNNSPSAPRAIAFDAEQSDLVIAHELALAGVVTVIHPDTLVFRDRMQFGGLAQDVAVRPVGGGTYVANGWNMQGDGVVVLDRRGSELTRIPVHRPQILSFSDRRYLYVGTQPGRLVIIDTTKPKENALLGELPLLRGGFTGLAIDRQSQRLIATGGAPAEIVYMRTTDLF